MRYYIAMSQGLKYRGHYTLKPALAIPRKTTKAAIRNLSGPRDR